MSRMSNRVSAAVVAGVVAVALTISGAGAAGAAPASGPITEARDVLGVWLGELTGYQEGQEVDWQYRLTVRKTKGQAGVAWQEWRHCANHEAACAAGKDTGGGWGQPSRLLFVMDKAHVIHGVSETGVATVMPDPTGDTMAMAKLCVGPQDQYAAPVDATVGGTQQMAPFGAMAVTGTLYRQ